MRRVPKVAPVQTPVQAPARAPSGNCSNASAFSQQFINNPNGRYKVRCGPQAEAPVTYGRGEDRSSIAVPSGTRVVRRQVFDRRQNTTNVTVPSGYRTVWKDDRLNPNRAERTLQPAQVGVGVAVPSGYRRIEDAEGRLNPMRGVRSVAGNSQTSQIWSNTVPRTLLQVPTSGRVVTVPVGSARVQVPQTTVSRAATAVNLTSTTGIARASERRLFVRVATYASEDDARLVAKSLARRGLPMNLGHVKSSSNKVVLAGPFASQAQADAALAQVHGAGYRNARLNK
ncbi:MAG: SPOR domain-containing protein [Rhodobacteraceae bacterium]|nr:SPOR domain-containing protein [Paracoccaceae bacterium]